MFTTTLRPFAGSTRPFDIYFLKRPREEPRFSEISAAKSLRKRWEKQNRIMANTNRISTVETDAGNARTPRGVGVSTLWRRQKPVAKYSSRSFVLIGLFDRTNGHLFQALLYRVAPSVRAPFQISSGIRAILQQQRNTTMIMGEVIEPRGRAGGMCW